MNFIQKVYDDIFARLERHSERENGSAGVISAQNPTPLNGPFKGILGDVRGGCCAGIVLDF